MTGEQTRALDLFGSRVRIHVGAAVKEASMSPRVAALQAEAFLRNVHRELTRFDPASALSELNADRSPSRGVSPLLLLAVEAAVRGARDSGGLVDPTRIEALERAGYAHSRIGAESTPLREALRLAPDRRPARPDPASRWRAVNRDQVGCVVSRPPGLRLDLGGTAKGLAADLAAARLGGYATYAIDAGGDVRVGGTAGVPRLVEVADPFGGRPLHSFELLSGAVATSGIGTRVWCRDGGGFAHHLIDPASGEPAWTGVVQVSALAPTGVEAEVLAKAALLSGPGGAARWLRWGGVVVLDDGETVVCEAHPAQVELSAT